MSEAELVLVEEAKNSVKDGTISVTETTIKTDKTFDL